MGQEGCNSIGSVMPVFAGGGGGGGVAELNYVTPVRAASVANIASLSTLLIIDGVNLNDGDRVLVKDQSTPTQNGIYEARAGAWNRAPDFDETSEVIASTVVAVEEGTANADTAWLLATNNPIIVDTTALTFVPFGTTTPLADTAPVDVDTAAAVLGVSSRAARQDHKHDIATAVPGAIEVGDAAVEGVALSLARSDHQHALAAPDQVTTADATAGVIGNSPTPARQDHRHNVPTAAPNYQSVGVVPNAGTDSTLARSDHRHGIAVGAAVEITDSTNSSGNSTVFIHSNHQHAHGNRGGGTLHPSAWAGANGFLPKCEPNGALAPTINDDSSQGFSIGSLWYETGSGAVYICTDATLGAAVWTEINNSAVLGGSAPQDVDTSAASAGISALASRQDHKHDVATAAATGLDASSTSKEGTALSLARSDHTHEISEAGSIVDGGVGNAQQVGTALGFARKDHGHGFTATIAGSLSTINAGDAAAEGVLATFPRGDHQHAVATGAATTVDADTANAEGVSTDLARADHTHDIPTGSPADLVAGGIAVDGVSASLIRTDHVHAAPVAAAVEITDATNGAGSSGDFVHSDHTHAHGNRGGGTLHAVATGATAGFMSATDKTNLDNHIASTSNPHVVTITQAYDDGGGVITLNGTDGGLRLQGSALATGRRAYFETLRLAVDIFTVDYDTTTGRSYARAEGAGGLDFEYASGSSILRLVQDQLEMLPNNVTVTSAALHVILLDSTVTLNFVNADFGSFIDFGPTIAFDQAADATEMLKVFYAHALVQNVDGEANDFSSVRHVVSALTYRAVNAAVGFTDLTDFYAGSTVEATGTGALNGPDNTWIQFHATGTIGAAASVSGDRVAFFADDISVTGAFDGGNIGLQIPELTQGSGSALVAGIQCSITSGTNKYFIYHTGTAQSAFGGAMSVTGELSIGGAGAAYLRHNANPTQNYLLFETSIDRVTLHVGTLATFRSTQNDVYVNPNSSSNVRLHVMGAGPAVFEAGDYGYSAVGFFGAGPAARVSAYTVTNPVTRKSFDTTTVTLQQLAEVVGTIIADHKTYGLFQ